MAYYSNRSQQLSGFGGFGALGTSATPPVGRPPSPPTGGRPGSSSDLTFPQPSTNPLPQISECLKQSVQVAKRATKALSVHVGIGVGGNVVGLVAGALLWKEHRVLGALIGTFVVGSLSYFIGSKVAGYPSEAEMTNACEGQGGKNEDIPCPSDWQKRNQTTGACECAFFSPDPANCSPPMGS